MTSRKCYAVTLYLPERYSYNYTELIARLFPRSLSDKRGQRGKWINVSLIELWQHLYPAEIPLTLGDLVKEMQVRLNASQSEIITIAIAFHAGRGKHEAMRSL